MFLCFINCSTLTTDQRIQATLMQNLFENVHTVREEEATWSGWLPCAFFHSSPTAHHNDAILHSPKQPMPSTPKCLYAAGRLTANENHTLWFLIFVKSTGGSVAVYVVDS